MARPRLKELREKVLGNGRGREVEVDPSGEVVLDPEGGQDAIPSDQETRKPKGPKMSPHTWGV